MSSKAINLGKDEKIWFKLSYKTDLDISFVTETQFPADIYIELMDEFNCEDFAIDMQEWCEFAQNEDRFEDEDVIIECYEK